MAGTPEGAAKAAAKIKEKYGENHYSEIGKRGAAAYNAKPKHERAPRGFAAMNPEERRAAGRKGGKARLGMKYASNKD